MAFDGSRVWSVLLSFVVLFVLHWHGWIVVFLSDSSPLVTCSLRIFIIMRSLTLLLVLCLGSLACVNAFMPYRHPRLHHRAHHDVATTGDAVIAQEKPAELLMAGAFPAYAELHDVEAPTNVNASNKNYVLYKQCDARWKNERLGTSSSNTICSAGCAMSSLTMALASYGVKLNGAAVTPSTLNSWLTGHGGYVSGDLLVWAAANQLGGPKYQNYYKGYGSMSVDALNAAASRGQPVIVNVHNGGHWVLVTGPAAAGSRTFPVNDPGYNAGTYQYSEMGNFVVYTAA